MYNLDKVIPGIIILILFLTTPIWLNLANLKALPPKDPHIGQARMCTTCHVSEKGPDEAVMSEKCVAETQYMREYHMKLLDEWREKKIRKGEVYYKGLDGKTYVMSLQRTCLKCHSDYSNFCYRCHKFTGVQIDCFNCHIAEKEEIK